MSIFRVQCDYLNGIWTKDHPHPVVEVLAATAKEAAELVCGMKLKTRGHAGQYSAKVWPVGGVRDAHQIAHFYSA